MQCGIEQLADAPATDAGCLGAGGVEGDGLHNNALGEFVRAFGRPAGYQCYHLMIGRGNQLGVGGVLLGRNTLFGNEQSLLHGVEVFLPSAVKSDLVAGFDIIQIFEYFTVAADMTGQHNVTAFAGVSRATVLAHCIFGHLPYGDILAVLLLHIPAYFHNF